VTITIITLFPEVFAEFLQSSIIGRGIEKKLVKVKLIRLRDFARDKHKTCDDAPFGDYSTKIWSAAWHKRRKLL